MKSFIPYKYLFALIVILLTSSCTTLSITKKNIQVHGSISSFSQRIASTADRCWSQKSSFFQVGRIIDLKPHINGGVLITADWYSFDIGATRFLDLEVFEKNGRLSVNLTEYYDDNAMEVMEKWIQGDSKCHKDMFK